MGCRTLIYLVLVASCLFSTPGEAQSTDPEIRIGFALNSGFNGEVFPIRLIPTLTVLKGKSQFELGAGFHPFIRKDQNLYSADINYKYYPNGVENKFNMYLLTKFSYVFNPRKTYYPSTYHYLFLNCGYGFEILFDSNVYMGTNMSIGGHTYSKSSEIPYEHFAEKNMFDEFGYNMAFQFNLGYRFK